jgi:hypothetical protein
MLSVSLAVLKEQYRLENRIVKITEIVEEGPCVATWASDTHQSIKAFTSPTATPSLPPRSSWPSQK